MLYIVCFVYVFMYVISCNVCACMSGHAMSSYHAMSRHATSCHVCAVALSQWMLFIVCLVYVCYVVMCICIDVRHVMMCTCMCVYVMQCHVMKKIVFTTNLMFFQIAKKLSYISFTNFLKYIFHNFFIRKIVV